MRNPMIPRQPMGQSPQKAQNTWKTVRRLFPYWLRYWKQMVGLMLCSFISVGVTLTAPLIIGQTIDNCIHVPEGIPNVLQTGIEVDFSLMFRYLALLLLVYLAGLLANWFSDYGMTVVSQRVVATMRFDMNRHLLGADVAYYDVNSRGELLSRFVSDVELIRDGLGQTLVQLLTTVVSMVGMVVVMGCLSLHLTGLVCLSIPLVLLLSRIVIRRSRTYFSQQQVATGHLNAIVEESVEGLRTVRSLGAEHIWRAKFAQVNEQVRQTGIKAQVNSGMLMPLLRFLDNMTYILVAVFGGLLATQGIISVGIIQSFLLYTRHFLRPVNQIATQLNQLQSAIAGAERIFEMLDCQPKVTSPAAALKPETDVAGSVEFRNVWFSYKETPNDQTPLPDSHWILRDISFTAQPGQVVAIVGGTGAGKTTMMNLLERFYDVNRGQILVDGREVRDYDLTFLRDSMAIVLQEPTLFTDTVQGNIAYGEPKRSELSLVQESARQAMAHDFIMRLPDDYGTLLSRQAETLSHGQKQLLTIARAIHSQAPMLVLDEATSNVDTHTEILLQKAISNLTAGRTCFMIAHRLSTIRNADLILVLEHGRLVEQGNHQQLMQQNGRYKKLFDSQFAL